MPETNSEIDRRPCTPEGRAVFERFGASFGAKRDARAAFGAWVAPDDVQHDPAAPDGRAAAKRIIAGGDIVAIQNLLVVQPIPATSASPHPIFRGASRA